MSQTERYKRLRLLVKGLNKQRRQQASKVDILCNDLIGAQRSFLRRLQDIGFAAEFYRSLLGGTDLNSVLARAGRVIRQELPGAGVTFFIRQPDGCEVHACQGDESLYGEHSGPDPKADVLALGARLHECFDAELVDNICKHNRPCTLEDIAGTGRDGDWEALNQFSLITLPLSDLGRSLGFVLLYCPLPQVLNTADVRRVSPALHGLAQAVRALRVALPARE